MLDFGQLPYFNQGVYVFRVSKQKQIFLDNLISKDSIISTLCIPFCYLIAIQLTAVCLNRQSQNHKVS